MNASSVLASVRGYAALACLSAMALAVIDAKAASLFGDYSCRHWVDLAYPKKKDWANAFLAPLSLTHQGLQRTGEDRYNSDPKAFEAAIRGIDEFCVSHPELGPADGAVVHLDKLLGK